MFEISEDNDMILTDEDGVQEKVKILFYFHNDQRGKDYYFLYRMETPDEIMVLASSDGESLETLSDEEYDEAEQVFEAYENDPEILEARK